MYEKCFTILIKIEIQLLSVGACVLCVIEKKVGSKWNDMEMNSIMGKKNINGLWDPLKVR